MRWTAMNGVGALLWIVGLSMALAVAHPGSWGGWVPGYALPLGTAVGIVGLATLLWANLTDA